MAPHPEFFGVSFAADVPSASPAPSPSHRRAGSEGEGKSSLLQQPQQQQQQTPQQLQQPDHRSDFERITATLAAAKKREEDAKAAARVASDPRRGLLQDLSAVDVDEPADVVDWTLDEDERQLLGDRADAPVTSLKQARRRFDLHLHVFFFGLDAVVSFDARFTDDVRRRLIDYALGHLDKVQLEHALFLG